MNLTLYFEPRVTLISRPQFLEPAHLPVNWVGESTDGEKLGQYASRLCYMAQANASGRDAEAYFANILSQQHGSILEHANYSFLIEGVSRALTHELTRHRAGCGYCLAGDTEVYSGSQVNGRFDGIKRRWTLQQLYDWSHDPRRKGRLKLIKVRAFNGERFVPAHIAGVAASGVKPLFRIELEDGKSIRASEDHLFLTEGGWVPVRELTVGGAIATNGQPLYQDREWLRQRYHDEGLLLREIAELAGTDQDRVRRWIAKFGLQKAIGQGMRGRPGWNTGITGEQSHAYGRKMPAATRRLLSEQKRGERNPSWRGDEASDNAGRLRANRRYPEREGTCARCGECVVLHRHHRDRNTRNNSPENIERLCSTCHQHEHHLGVPMTARWRTIVSITPDGEEMTYDLEVAGEHHNFVANGIVTHNSQLSQRFVDESAAAFVVPPAIRDSPEAVERFRESCADDLRAYQNFVEHLLVQYADTEDRTLRRKRAREAARAVLPNATETKLVWSANLRALRHVIALRGSEHADAEIRELALRLLEIMRSEAPNAFQDFAVVGGSVVCGYGKV